MGPGAVAATAGRPAEPHPDRAAELASLFETAGISVTSNPAHPTDLVIVAIGPEGGVLGPSSAAGRAADAVGLHLPYQNLAEIVPSQLTSAGAPAPPAAPPPRLGLAPVRPAAPPGPPPRRLLFPPLPDARGRGGGARGGDGKADPDSGESPARLGPPQIQEWPDGEWVVRQVPGSAAAKEYRCPGCDQEIRPGTAHVVVWPAHTEGLAERRHWHNACWRRRPRRPRPAR